MKNNMDVRRWLSFILMITMICASVDIPMIVRAGDYDSSESENDYDVDVDVLGDTDSETDTEYDDSYSTSWQNDYVYEISDDYIIIYKYTGSNKNVCVPAKAVIGGKNYQTKVDWNIVLDGIETLSFEKGVKADVWMGFFGINYRRRDGSEIESKLANVSLKNVDLRNLDFDGADSIYLFEYMKNLEEVNMSGLDLSKVTDFSRMFYGCTSLKKVDMSNVDARNVQDMSKMFMQSGLKEINMESLRADSLETMSQMFWSTNIRNIDLTKVKASNVQDMSEMFINCFVLADISIGGSFKTEKLKYSKKLFGTSNNALTDLDLSAFNLKSINDNENCFNLDGCKALKTIKTPAVIPNSISIKLPYTFYDEAGKEYTCIDSSCVSLTLYNSKQEMPNDTKWQNDFTYRINKNSIIVSSYNRDTAEYCIPAKAVIGGNEYDTKLEYGFDPGYIKKLSFEKGVSIVGESFAFCHENDGESICNYILEEIDLSQMDLSEVEEFSGGFRDYLRLKKVNMNGVKLPNCTALSGLFRNCVALEEVDLNDVYAPKLDNICYMFAGAASIKTVDLSSIHSTCLLSCSEAFANCLSLEYVDISNMDMANLWLEEWEDVFINDNALISIETPTGIKPNVIIYLPATFYDADGNEYKSLPSLNKSISLKSDPSMFGPEVKRYKVDFLNDDLSLINSYTVKEGEKVSVPDETQLTTALHLGEETDWKFDKWIVTIDGKRSSFDPHKDVVKNNITCTAQYKKIGEIKESPMNPVPEIDENTREIHLVKGQKFALFETGWKSDNQKIINISKKNVLTAKKITNSPVKITKDDRSIDVYVTTPYMSVKTIKMEVGTTQPVLFNYDFENLNVLWYSNSPDVATVTQDGKVTACGKGTSTISAFVNGKAYNCKVKVSETVIAEERTLHLMVNGTKTVSLKGIKKPIWKADDETMVFIKGNKIKGLTSGDTFLRTEYDGKQYRIHLYVEDPTIKTAGISYAGTNKYTVTLAEGESKEIVFSNIYQPVVFKSNSENAYVDEDMIIHANRKGKAKQTAKINGKTVTINVVVE